MRFPCIPSQPLADPLFFSLSLTRRHVESSLCCFHLTAATSAAAADNAAKELGEDRPWRVRCPLNGIGQWVLAGGSALDPPWGASASLL